MSHIVGTKDNFQSEVIDYKGKVLVDFWASWCGPCQMLGPVLEQLMSKNEGKFKLVKVNVDEQQELAMQYQISSIPAVYIFENGQQKDIIVGFNQPDRYIQALGL